MVDTEGFPLLRMPVSRKTFPPTPMAAVPLSQHASFSESIVGYGVRAPRVKKDSQKVRVLQQTVSPHRSARQRLSHMYREAHTVVRQREVYVLG